MDKQNKELKEFKESLAVDVNKTTTLLNNRIELLTKLLSEQIELSSFKIESKTDKSISEIDTKTKQSLKELKNEMTKFIENDIYFLEISSIKERLSDINNTLETYISKDVGEVFTWINEECPTGSIPLNGQYIGDFEDLILAVGSDELPDFRDKFLRIYNDEGNRDILSTQNDSTAVNGLRVVSGGEHTHYLNVDLGGDDLSGGGYFADGSQYYTTIDIQTTLNGSHSHSLIGDTETRPINMSVNMCIKVGKQDD
jgi:hypothetical protein